MDTRLNSQWLSILQYLTEDIQCARHNAIHRTQAYIYSCKQQYHGDDCRIFVKVIVDDCHREDFKRGLFARTSPSGVFNSMFVCLSPSCHHVGRCGRLHAPPLTRGRRLERRRGRHQGRCRCYRLEIVVDVVSKRYGWYVTTLATSPGLETPCHPIRVDWTRRPDVLMMSTCDDVHLWWRSWSLCPMTFVTSAKSWSRTW